MQVFIPSRDEMEQRLRALRMTWEELARKAGVANSTAHRFAKGIDCKGSTLRKLTAALVAAEQEALRALCVQHRDEAEKILKSGEAA